MPFYHCGVRHGDLPDTHVDDRGYEKAEVCRSGQCGRYDREFDTCHVLTDRGKNGAISWLYSHPDAHCVHPDTPLF